MGIKVAINGFGRIGRQITRMAADNWKDGDIELVAINARANTDTLAHLFKYDSAYGIYGGTVEAKEDSLIINGKEIRVFAISEAVNLPWEKLGIDIVVESTGVYTQRERAMEHVRAGAKKVIITAPGKDEDVTVVLGVNEEDYNSDKHTIISNASCTTNCLAPVAKVLQEKFGIINGFMTTVHSYTNDQKILDKTHKDLRRARSAAESIIPTTTGAAKAVGKVLPELNGKLNGLSLRVPTPTVSITDLVCCFEKEVSVESINSALKDASENELKGILGYSDEPLVSMDYKGDNRSSIVDSLSTMVIGDKMAKVMAWYDNEWGYSRRTVDLVEYIAKKM